jgi:UDP-N-acetylmuramoyl-L-alanyl-D-glutamate--2,6-diaminopimelate ligase
MIKTECNASKYQSEKENLCFENNGRFHGKFWKLISTECLLNFNGKEFWTTLTGKFNVIICLLAFELLGIRI